MADDKTQEKESLPGDIRLKFSGLEHVREVRRGDLGVHPDSDEVLTWNASNNFISPVGLTEEEVQRLAGSGGNWAVVTEESSTAPETSESQDEKKIDLPTYTEPAPADSTDESSSDETQS